MLPADYDFEALKELVPMQAGDVPVTYVRNEDLEKMTKVLKQKSKWSAFKEGGINTLHGDALNSLQYLLGEFAKVGLHPVPCGQLESFVPTITLHGPKWVNAVIEKYPDLDDPVYDDAKTFIRSFI